MLKLKYKPELIILIILIPILAYVGWQAYNSYFKTPEVEELEKEVSPARDLSLSGVKEEPVIEITKPAVEEQPTAPQPKGTLDFTGFTERDPLKTSLPIKETIVKPKEEEKPKEKPKEITKKKEPHKEIVLPTFTVTGVVWGYSPRVIIDNSVYKIGDVVKGAKILNITNKGIHMLYEGKEFWVTR